MASTAMEVYNLLPHLDCGECGESSCVAFAVKLLNRDLGYQSCTRLTGSGEEKLEKELAYKVRPVEFGVGGKKVTVGGEDVAYRHERRYFHPPPFFLEIADYMNTREVEERLGFIQDFKIKVRGRNLALDGIAITESMDDVGFYMKAVKTAQDLDVPIILKSENPEIISRALEVLGERKPLIFGATEKNHQMIAELTLQYGCPVVASAEGLPELIDIGKSLKDENIEDIILHPIVDPSNLTKYLNTLQSIRNKGVNGEEEFRHPILVDSSDFGFKINELESSFHESLLSAMLLNRYSNLFILGSRHNWSLLSLLILRQGLYSDPKTQPSVESKLYEVGDPSEESPVIVTSNFSPTFYDVTQDLEENHIDAYLLPIDTGGLAVSVAMAGNIFSASKVQDLLEKSGVVEKVKHRKLILPGYADSIAREVEILTGWRAEVGPVDSGDLPGFLR
ncbi:acetyl-CoA decarbonylase/synthase complex subunit gamma [Candidatus Altiarchaeota archaeon]